MAAKWIESAKAMRENTLLLRGRGAMRRTGWLASCAEPRLQLFVMVKPTGTFASFFVCLLD